MTEPTKPDIEPIKTAPIKQDPRSDRTENIRQGTKTVATRTATTTASALVGESASKTFQTTSSSVLGHSGASFLASSAGQSVLAGGMSSIGAIGGAMFSKDKKRALARGVPSVLISLIPGVGIPLAIGANVVSGLVVDKIYTTIRDMNKDYIDLSLFIPENVQSSLDSLISKITKKLDALSMNFTKIKSSECDSSKVFEIAGKFKSRQKMFEKAAAEKFKISTTSNFGEHLLMARQLFREKVIDINDATKEVDEVIEFLENYLAQVSNNDDGKTKFDKKSLSKDVKANSDILKELKKLNEKLKEKTSNEVKCGLEKCELFVASEMQRIASLDAPTPDA